MASIIQKNKSYCVVYSYFEEDGKRKQKWESFKNMGDAKKRLKEVEYKEQIGTFVVPKCKTLDELLKEYVDLYGKEKWALSTYSSNVALIKNYVSPKIGTMKISDINTRVIERYYQSLLKTEAVPRIGQKTPKKYVTPHTVKDIHKILRSCFNQAVKWELMAKNPASNATVPKVESAKREIWTAEMLFDALHVCDDTRLAKRPSSGRVSQFPSCEHYLQAQTERRRYQIRTGRFRSRTGKDGHGCLFSYTGR